MTSRRQFITGIGAAAVAAALPAAAIGDGVALISASHPENIPIAGERLFMGDIVCTGFNQFGEAVIERMQIGRPSINKFRRISGIVVSNADAGQPVHMLDESALVDVEYDPAKRQRTGLRVIR